MTETMTTTSEASLEVRTDPRSEELRQMLRARRGALLASIRAGQSELRATGAERAETADEAGESGGVAVEAELSSALLEGRARLLDEVNLALLKVEEGTYGRCEECGEPIPLARLRALPVAVRCVSCQGAVEQRRRVGRHAGPAEVWDVEPIELDAP